MLKVFPLRNGALMVEIHVRFQEAALRLDTRWPHGGRGRMHKADLPDNVPSRSTSFIFRLLFPLGHEAPVRSRAFSGPARDVATRGASGVCEVIEINSCRAWAVVVRRDLTVRGRG